MHVQLDLSVKGFWNEDASFDQNTVCLLSKLHREINKTIIRLKQSYLHYPWSQLHREEYKPTPEMGPPLLLTSPDTYPHCMDSTAHVVQSMCACSILSYL